MTFLTGYLFTLFLAGPVASRPAASDLLDNVVEVLVNRYYDRELREDLPELARPYLERFSRASSPREERAVVHEFLAQIPVSHLGLVSEDAHDSLWAELRGDDQWTYGFQLARLEEGWFVDWVYEGGPADSAGLARGDQILSIDGIAPGESPVVDWRSDDAALPDTPLHGLRCSSGSRVQLLLRRSEGRVGRLDLPAQQYSAWRACQESVTVHEVGGVRVGYVHYWMIHINNSSSFLRELCRERFAGCDALVLDLRGRGGAAQQAFGMIRALDRDRGVWGKPVVALVHADSRSAKEVIAHELQAEGDALIVGEKTHGAVIPASFEDVGQGAVLMFPSFTLGRYTDQIEGTGVTPDIRVDYPLAWTAGADPILEAGLEAARAWCSSLEGSDEDRR